MQGQRQAGLTAQKHALHGQNEGAGQDYPSCRQWLRARVAIVQTPRNRRPVSD